MERLERPEQKQPVLRRKLARKRAAPPVGGGAPPRAHPAERALTRACAVIGGGLHATAGLTGAREVGQAELLDMIEPDGFLTLLAPADIGADDDPEQGEALAGLLALDRAAFMALTEILTTGRLLPGDRPLRRATPTDAALLADFIDDLLRLRRQEGERQRRSAGPAPAVWQRGCFVADARLLPVLLQEGSFSLEVLEIGFTLGSETRSGRLLLGLPPALTVPLVDDDRDGAGGAGSATEGSACDRQVEAMVMGVPARLDAVLGRVGMPLAEALSLKPGSCLTLPICQLEEVRLESADRRVLALARLGQYRGMRALRLTAMSGGDTTPPPAPSPAPPSTPAAVPAPGAQPGARGAGQGGAGQGDSG